MNKNNLIVNVILGLAILILYIFHFSNDKNTKKNAVRNIKHNKTNSSLIDNGNIAVVNIDTLNMFYAYSIEIEREIQQKKIEIYTKFQQKKKIFDLKYQNFFKKSKNMSQFETEIKKKEIEHQKQKLTSLEKNLVKELSNFENKAKGKLNKKIKSALNGYLSNRSYKVVVSYNKNGSILWSKKGTDITSEIIYLLNEEYKLEHQKK